MKDAALIKGRERKKTIEQVRTNRFDKAKLAKRQPLIYIKQILFTVAINLFIEVSARPWRSSYTTTCKAAFQDNMNANKSNHVIPKELLQPFGAYPNIFDITEEMRSQFHPVIKFPRRDNSSKHGSDPNNVDVNYGRKLFEMYDYIVKDHTVKDDAIFIGGKKLPQLLCTREEAVAHAKAFPNPIKGYDVGRYDEDRRGMYTSSLFEENNSGSGNESTRRTVHVGVDIGAPVGTEVHAFEDGIVHSVGYNPDVGDYGHVIVIEHNLSSSEKIFALYGHLSKSVLNIKVGENITKGSVIGHIGNTDENGGWTGTHLHFQIAKHPPEIEHDMPGAVRSQDRNVALLEYGDPRYILGELY